MSEIWISPMQEPEEDVIVEAGYIVEHPSGTCLVVSEDCAAGMNGKLYQTVGWRKRAAERKAMWENRPWWRKALNMTPKGWPKPVTDGTPLLGGLLSDLFLPKPPPPA